MNILFIAGELGGIQATGQQVTCIGSEILSASTMNNNILDGSNSEQVGPLDGNIIPNGTTLYLYYSFLMCFSFPFEMLHFLVNVLEEPVLI